jgi:hypothetical protein
MSKLSHGAGQRKLVLFFSTFVHPSFLIQKLISITNIMNIDSNAITTLAVHANNTNINALSEEGE